MGSQRETFLAFGDTLVVTLHLPDKNINFFSAESNLDSPHYKRATSDVKHIDFSQN